MTIFEFSDYKAFLKRYIENLPRKGRGEINKIAAHIRVHPTFISQVFRGDKDLTAEHAYHLCPYLGLQPLESDYFIYMVQHERAGTAEFKKYYRKKLDEIRKSSLHIANRLAKHHTLTDHERSIFYSNWIYLYVWLFTSIGKGQTIENVAEQLAIARAKASEILNFLKTAQLCVEDKGWFQMKSQHVHLEFGSPFLSRHHMNWRMKAMQRSDDLGEEEMMFTSPISISKKDFGRIREELVNVIKSTSAIIKESPAEDVACLNLDLFWIRK
jgi:uncharacterized protein (TIGR02147 family)